jgi:Mrp family chromosome partitioning ATPase
VTRPLIVAVTRAWETELVTTLGASRTWEVARRCPDLADLLAAAAAGLADVAVISADLRLLDRSALSDLGACGVGLLGVHAPGDDPAERRLRQWGLHAVISADAGLDDLEEALQLAFERRSQAGLPEVEGHRGIADGQSPDLESGPAARQAVPGGPEELDTNGPPGAVIAVWGPTGSPGRSLLARSLAAEYATAGWPTLLMDADSYGGTQAQALALLNEAPGVLAAARAADQGYLDLTALARLSPYVCDELRILTGIPSALRWPELRAAPLLQILALARSLARVIVVDVGFCLEEDEELSYDTRAPRRNAATVTCLLAADHVVVVGGADPIGLQRLVRGIGELTDVLQLRRGGPAPAQPARTVVVNRVREASVGEGPGERIRAVLDRFAGVSDAVLLPDDPATVDAALLAGQTLIEWAPGSEVRRGIRDLADRVGAAVGLGDLGSARESGSPHDADAVAPARHQVAADGPRAGRRQRRRRLRWILR